MGNSSSSDGSKPLTFRDFVLRIHRDSESFSQLCKNVADGKGGISDLQQKIYMFNELETTQLRLADYKSSLMNNIQKSGKQVQEHVILHRRFERKDHHAKSAQNQSPGSNQRQKPEDDRNLVFTPENLHTQLVYMQSVIDTVKQTNAQLKKERDKLQLRLSKVVGDKVSKNNPAIADLSDKNRPTNLAEFYSELYDNEWTDAFEELTKSGYTELESIDILRTTLQNTFDFCKKKSDLLKQKASDTVNVLFEEYKEYQKQKSVSSMFTVRCSRTARDKTIEDLVLPLRWRPKSQPAPQLTGADTSMMEHGPKFEIDLEDTLIILQKDFALSMVPAVQKAYLRASWSSECIPALKPYIKQCLFIGWMMVVQSPPLCFSQDPEPGAPLDTNMYKIYTKSGRTIDYLVWPAMLLHDKGPLLAKGVAQARAKV